MSVATLLRQADIFDELTTTQLELIASICEERHYDRGELIFADKTVGDELYVVITGEVNIEITPSLISGQYTDDILTISTMRRGQSFGEISLVDEGLRSAAARAAQHDTHLVVIPRDKLTLLCDTYPQLGYHLMRNLAADLAMKIRNTDLRIREQLYWSHSEKKT